MRRTGLAARAVLLGLSACPEAPLKEAQKALDEGRLEAAGEAFLREARRDPAHLAAWDGAVDVWCVRRAHVARCLEVLDLELDLLGSIARHHDALSVSLEARARARMLSGLPQAALADLERARSAAPERGSVAVAQARALAMLGRREEALEALDQARSLSPQDPEIDEVLGLLPGPRSVVGNEAGFGGVSPGPGPKTDP